MHDLIGSYSICPSVSHITANLLLGIYKRYFTLCGTIALVASPWVVFVIDTATTVSS